MKNLFPFKKNVKIKKRKTISHEKGFTLIDTMATLALFILLTTIIAANYPDSQTKVELANAVADVQGTVRDTQLKASAVQNSKDLAGGYGLYFTKATSTSFVQFKDLTLVAGEDPTKFAGNGIYDGITELSQVVAIPEGFHISNICVGNSTARPFDNTLCSNTSSTLGTVTIEYPRSSNQPVITANSDLATKYAAACVEFSADKSSATGNVKSLVVSVSGFSSTTIGGCAQAPISFTVSEGATVNGSLAANILAGSGKDITAPALALSGSNPLYVSQGFLYTDPGATATDNVDGDITSKIVTKVESVTKKVVQSSTFTTSASSDAKMPSYNAALDRVDILQDKGLFSYKDGIVQKIADWGISPYGVAVDSLGNIYVGNYSLTGSSSNNVTKITPAGVSTILGTTGSNPRSVTVDASGNVYTANYGSNNVTKITPAGVSTILGTTGSYPAAITVDTSGNVYTANSGSNNVTKITPAGISTVLGTTGSIPLAIAVDVSGNVYTGNSGSNNVTKITPAGISVALAVTGSGPTSVTVDVSGNVYTANVGSNNVTKITPAGVSTTLGTTGSSPYGISIDSFGNVYTANVGSNNVTKITPAGVSTVLGTTGSNPRSVTVDVSGNVYTANSGSNSVSRITSEGVSKMFAVTSVVSGPSAHDSSGNLYTISSSLSKLIKIDQNGAMSIFSDLLPNPAGVTVDSLDNVYVVHSGEHGRVTKITKTGETSTVSTAFFGTNPVAVAADEDNNLYVASLDSNNVIQVTPSLTVSLLGETGSRPKSVTIDSLGNVYTADSGSKTVTKITSGGASSVVTTTSGVPITVSGDSFDNIYVLSDDGNVTKITKTGNVSILGNAGTGSVSMTISPRGDVYVYNSSNLFSVFKQINQTTPTSSVDTNILGDYLVRYSVSDSAGNKVETTRDVIVE